MGTAALAWRPDSQLVLARPRLGSVLRHSGLRGQTRGQQGKTDSREVVKWRKGQGGGRRSCGAGVCQLLSALLPLCTPSQLVYEVPRSPEGP